VALLNPDQIVSLVWGLLLGSIFQVLFQLPGLRDGRFRVQIVWSHPAVRRIVILYTPILAALLINQVAIWISYNLAITTGDNSVTYMTYATTLYQFPLGLVVTALSIATLPTLSQLATAYRTAAENHEPDAQQRLAEYKDTLASGLRLVITLILPAATGLFALAGPIISLLLEHGLFTAQDTEITTQVLRFYIFGLAFAAVDQMLVYASYSRKDTWRPALAGIFSIIVYTVTAVMLLEPLGLLSLMVADAVKHITHTLIMLLLLQRNLGGLAGYQIGPALFKSIVAAAFSGLAAYAVASVTSSFLISDNFLSRLIIVVSAGLAGLLVYLGGVFVLDIRDAKSLWFTVANRTRR
jgi:putative peptidoglycan lipid II flippase